jgi:predicted Zn-dependent protease
MKIVVLAAALIISIPVHHAAAQTVPASPANVAEAYAQFLIGHHLEEDDDNDGAIAAYKRAIALDPSAADITAQLAGLYLRQNKIEEAMSSAQGALKIAPANSEANRVLGIVYAALAESSGGRSAKNDDNLAKAIQHLELAVAHPAGGIVDPNVRATLARAYINNGAFDKAIPLLSDLVKEEPGWGDGPMLLAEAYAGAGRTKDAIAWLEEQNDPRLMGALGDFYEREQRWSDAANAYERAVERAPRNQDLKTRYASTLLKTGRRADTEKARDVLSEVVSARADVQSLYLLSQAQRRLGDA